MRSRRKQRSWVLVLSVYLVFAGFGNTAVAAMIGTQDLSVQSRVHAADELRQTVSERLVDLGVSKQLVQDRVAALSVSELQLLDQKLDEVPAGAGAIEVIGIVFLVLLILELVGITNVFKGM